jgi:hypothetical protein
VSPLSVSTPRIVHQDGIGSRPDAGRRLRRIEHHECVVGHVSNAIDPGESERNVAAAGEDGGVGGLPGRREARIVGGCGEDTYDSGGKRGDDGRGETLGHEYSIALLGLEQALHRALIQRKPVQQSSANIDEQVRRCGGSGLLDRLLGTQSRVDPCAEDRGELLQDRHLGLEELGLGRRKLTKELFDITKRPGHRAPQSSAIFPRGSHFRGGLGVARPKTRAADRDPLDDRLRCPCL